MSGAIVVGVGPGIGLSVARRFANEGLPVTVLARTAETIDRATADLAASGARVRGIRADVTDERALREALDTAVAHEGVPDVLVYNVGLIRADAPGELSIADHLEAWKINVGGAMTAATHIGSRMVDAGKGTIVFTGGMPNPEPTLTSLSLGKAGLRAFAELLGRSYGPAGVHVATVTVCGPVAPGTEYDPDAIAEHYWRLHTQAVQAWEHEVVFAGEPVA
ncbi:SDR family NAD(P)-dependent oxidoreductase [Embleya hyalina]|uniref:Putative short chain dehydrogenase n=1 Tax=Embleya hyalina TaxID=516124 RepID=A0A401YQV6_9ACTN|nr:SDR family NAD(P)-dependent oxidoreductase [Embleya hyalina]GCD96998.1 putative short chain dehydrogenase [Embleya hyalina]